MLHRNRKMLYFAYGSNMSFARLLVRVPSASFVATAMLARHELRFHKISKDGSAKCDAFLTDDPAHQVMGVVFEIDEAEKPVLDKQEGLGYGYDEKQVVVITNTGNEICALTYYALKIDDALRPYQWYKHHVVTGATEHGLPEDYIKKIIAVEAVTDADQARFGREMAIYADN